MSLSSKLASQVKEIRTTQNLTATELATLLYNDPNQRQRITNFENEKRGITLNTLERILEALNYSAVLVPNNRVKEITSILNN